MDHVLTNIILLGEVEELADVVGTLGTKTTGDTVVREVRDGLVSHLCDDQVEDGNVVSDNATADRLALALSGTTLSVGLGTLFTQQPHASVGQHTLAHGESLLVVSSRNAQDRAGKLVAENVTVNLLTHPTFVKVLQLLLIIRLEDGLHSGARACDIDLFQVKTNTHTELDMHRYSSVAIQVDDRVSWVHIHQHI